MEKENSYQLVKKTSSFEKVSSMKLELDQINKKIRTLTAEIKGLDEMKNNYLDCIDLLSKPEIRVTTGAEDEEYQEEIELYEKLISNCDRQTNLLKEKMVELSISKKELFTLVNQTIRYINDNKGTFFQSEENQNKLKFLPKELRDKIDFQSKDEIAFKNKKLDIMKKF